MNEEKYPVSEEMAKELDTRFTYHPPHGDQPGRYGDLRYWAKDLAKLIVKFTPDCREQAIALTKLEEAVFWANAAIARREKPTEADVS